MRFLDVAWRGSLVLAVLLAFSALQSVVAQSSKSVWAVDFVRTKPGQNAAYLASVQTNWAVARYYAQQAGYIVSYKAYTT